jgi:hypothetical protein
VKVIRVKDQEDCFDGSLMKDVLLDGPVTRSFIEFIGEKGDLSYFPNFASPFFKVDIKGHYFLKGIENNTSLNLVLYKRNPGESLTIFLNHMDEYSGKINKTRIEHL